MKEAFWPKTPDDVRFGSEADMCGAIRDVRYGPRADIVPFIRSPRRPERVVSGFDVNQRKIRSIRTFCAAVHFLDSRQPANSSREAQYGNSVQISNSCGSDYCI